LIVIARGARKQPITAAGLKQHVLQLNSLSILCLSVLGAGGHHKGNSARSVFFQSETNNI
jgi:hypothetical protein